MSAFAKQIAALEAERARMEARAEKLLADAGEREDGALTTDEQAIFDNLTSTDPKNLGDIAKLDRRIENIRALEQAAAQRATPVRVNSDGDRLVELRAKQRPKGTMFAMLAHCLHVNKGDYTRAAAYARKRDDHLVGWLLEQPEGAVESAYERMLTAAAVAPGSTTDSTFAATLVDVNQNASDFRELLRPKTVIGRMQGIRSLSFDGAGSLKIKGQSAGVAGGWLGEGAPIAVERLGFDDITLTPKKLGVLVVVSNELLRRSTPSVLEMIRDDMIEGAARTLDARFLGTAAVPGTAPPGIFNGAPTSAGSGTGTLADIDADLKAALSSFASNEIPSGGWTWVVPESGLVNLMFIRDGNGNYAYKDEIASGTLQGHAILASNAQAANVVSLVAAPQVVKADEMMPTIDLSTDATLSVRDDPDADLSDNVNATPVQSMYQTDSTAIRMVLVTDWARRHTNAAYRRTATSW